MRGDVTDAGQPNDKQLKIELLSQWKLEAESRNTNTSTNTNTNAIAKQSDPDS